MAKLVDVRPWRVAQPPPTVRRGIRVWPHSALMLASRTMRPNSSYCLWTSTTQAPDGVRNGTTKEERDQHIEPGASGQTPQRKLCGLPPRQIGKARDALDGLEAPAWGPTV